MKDAPFIGLKDIEAHTLRLLGMGQARDVKSSGSYFDRGDVLYGRLRPYLNKIYQPHFSGLASGEFIVFPNQSHLDNTYLMYFFNQLEFVSYATRLNAGDRPRVDFDQLANYPFPLPPLPEQRRIVAEIEKQFTRLDAAEAALRRVEANLKRYRASVLKAACEGKLVATEAELAEAEGRDYEHAEQLLKRILAERRARYVSQEKKRKKYKEPVPPDISNLPELPGGWVWATIGQIGEIGEQTVLTGPFGTNLKKEDFTSEGVPVVTIGCLTEAGLNLEKAAFVSNEKANELNRYGLRLGDLLFSRMATVGRAGIVGQEADGCLFNYHLMRLRLDRDTLLPQFYMAYVRGSSQVRHYVKEANHGATRDGINTIQLLEMPVSVPPLCEQYRIVADVESRLSIIEQAETTVATSLKRVGRLRQSILRQAFCGQLVPQDPDDEPASVLLEHIREERAAESQQNRRRRPKAALDKKLHLLEDGP
ncbi:MAG: restriction endonuclease subunit S [Caldilineaceae bacterium]|nr:restriction endonuclease subunit S [Caldilineaceae bacterium]